MKKKSEYKKSETGNYYNYKTINLDCKLVRDEHMGLVMNDVIYIFVSFNLNPRELAGKTLLTIINTL